MSPLFNLCQGDTDLASPCELNPETCEALQILTDKIQTSFVSKQIPVILFAIISEFQTFELIVQWCDGEQKLWILERVFLPHTFSKTATTLIYMIVRLVSTGQK